MDQLNLTANDTAEMVPDEFLTWLMSDLDGKEGGGEETSQSIKTEYIGEDNSSIISSSYDGGGETLVTLEESQSDGYHNNCIFFPKPFTEPSQESINIKEEIPSISKISNDCRSSPSQSKIDKKEKSEKSHDQECKVGEKRKAPRSREIARECRRRQRERKEELERRVATLKKENQELREHFQNVSQRTTDIQRQRARMEKVMQDRLEDIERTPGDCKEQRELADLVLKFTDIYADYGSCRQKEVAFHLAQLEKLILPTRVTKMILWTLQQDYKFFEEKSSPIWGILVKELEMTPDQVNFLAQQRSEVLNLLLHLKESLNLITELKESIKDKHEAFDRECGKILNEASAKQCVRFILWITKNADKLAKVIPDFERSVPHVSLAPEICLDSHVEFK